jgi:hypothetical protein
MCSSFLAPLTWQPSGSDANASDPLELLVRINFEFEFAFPCHKVNFPFSLIISGSLYPSPHNHPFLKSKLLLILTLHHLSI